MKRKYSKLGFTLIELLAVIVIIIIVLAIAIPLISNILETVRKEAFKATAYSISDSGRFLMANDTNIGYEEFYYLDGVQYNADGKKLDYTGDGPKTGVVVLNEKKKVALAIHNGTYCATKSADVNKVTVTKTSAEDCKAYNIINTCDTWEQIALKYDVTLTDLLKANNVIDSKSSTCGLNIKIPLSSTSSNSNTAGGKTVYYKTYYTVGYVGYSENFTTNSYEYTVKLGVLPLNIEDIEVVRVTTQSVFESLDDFKRYITKKNMGEVIWPGNENPPEIDISQASVFKDHALRSDNMTADDVTVMCDTEACYATIEFTVDNMNNINPNYINSNPIAYTPIKFTVEFNGEAEMCAVRTSVDVAPGVFSGTGTSADPYLIESIEDLVALSLNVSGGNSYSGKYFALNNSLDLNNKRSYKDYSTTAFGDVNGNGTTEGLLMELTTGAGFLPIGNGTTQFAGNIMGKMNCVIDLYINRPTTSYVGFFGYQNGGTVSLLNFNNVNITGGDYTGGLAGYNRNAVVNETSITGNVVGNNYTALGAGYIFNDYGSPRLQSMTLEGNVTGANNVGGLVGYAYSYSMSDGHLSALYRTGSVVSTGTAVGRIMGGIGKQSGGATFVVSSIANKSITVNGNEITNTYPTNNHGATFEDLTALNDINFVELGLDTYIGGDNDGNGYYWDYDETGKIVRRNISEYPLAFNLTGLGTSESPYLISNFDDLRQISLKLGSTYKLTSDITYTNEKFYMIGSYLNNFTGTINGNGKTIYNLTINNPYGSYVGLVGYNRGTIIALNTNNLTITGKNYLGLVGYNQGTLKTINVTTANISGNDNVGTLVGYDHNGHVMDANVKANVTGNNNVALAIGYVFNDYGAPRVTAVMVEGNVIGANSVGGIVGYAYHYTLSSGHISGINKGGTIVSTGSTVGRVIGGNSGATGSSGYITSSLAKATITLNGSTVSSTSPNSNHGVDFTSLDDLNNLNFVELALDTYIGGDNDGDGYYWDYDENYKMVYKSITEYPLIFNLSGAGTSADPYLLTSYEDLKQATLKLGSVYRLANDIDLSGKMFYMLGSYLNNFSGTLYGNNKTISNLTIENPNGSYVGFIGYNRGTVTDLNVSNITINAKSNVGLVGYNKGTMKTLNASNININGYDNVGALAGYLYNGSVFDCRVSANITGNNNVGGVVGYINNDYSSPRVTSVIFEGNVTGNNSVGGLVGYAYYYTMSAGYVTGIYQGGNITAVGTNRGRIIGGRSGSGTGYTTSALSIASVTINGSTINNSSSTSNHGADFATLSDLNNINLVELALDTYIGGDNDGDGYYWDYDLSGSVVRKSIASYPLTFNLIGSGTAADPYLINNYEDLKQASLKLGAVYKLNSDIDMTDKNYYVLGSYLNAFSGTFNGNGKTISNLTINNPYGSYVGFMGNNSGTLALLNFDNLTVNAKHYTALVGYNRGTIKGINATNTNISGGDNVGGLVGHGINSTVTNCKIKGNVVGNNNVGVVVGYIQNDYGSPNITNVLAEGNATGVNNVGGVVGYAYYYTMSTGNIKVINVGGSVIATGSNAGRIIGRKTGSGTNYTVDSKSITSVTINGSTVTSTSSSSNHGLDIVSSDLLLDTTYTSIGFNFTDENLEYIWYIDGGIAKFREGNL